MIKIILICLCLAASEQEQKAWDDIQGGGVLAEWMAEAAHASGKGLTAAGLCNAIEDSDKVVQGRCEEKDRRRRQP